MAKSPPAFQFYPGDFIAGTLHLDAEAIGCYLLLLCYQWLHGNVPGNVATMAMICKKTPVEFEPVWAKIRDKFVESDNGALANLRLEAVRNRQMEISSKRRESGAKGGKAIAKQMLRKRGKQKTTKGRLKVEGRSLEISKKEMEQEFATWWDLVPKKIGKGNARAAYEKAVLRIAARGDDAPFEFLADRILAFRDSDKAKGEYCPHPATWLNGENYDDDPAAWQDARRNRDIFGEAR